MEFKMPNEPDVDVYKVIDKPISITIRREYKMQSYLVMRKDDLHVGQRTASLHSSMFPVLVQMPDEPGKYYEPEDIVREAFRQRGWDSYNGYNHEYLVMRIGGTKKVSFVPRPNYDTVIEDWFPDDE